MPSRELTSKKMADFLSAISNPSRIRIIEELRCGEKDVNGLMAILGISHSAVSQHLSILRGQKAVKNRREGNHVFYKLTQDNLSDWLLEGLDFIDGGMQSEKITRSALSEARQIWNHDKQ